MKYRIELEVELEVLPEKDLKQHASEMQIGLDELDLAPPTKDFLEQQIIYALTGENADEALFAGSDVFYRVKGVVAL